MGNVAIRWRDVFIEKMNRVRGQEYINLFGQYVISNILETSKGEGWVCGTYNGLDIYVQTDELSIQVELLGRTLIVGASSTWTSDSELADKHIQSIEEDKIFFEHMSTIYVDAEHNLEDIFNVIDDFMGIKYVEIPAFI